MRADSKRWAALVALAGGALASCMGSDDGAPATLPVLTTAPTTTTVPPPTSIVPVQYYEVQPGDSLTEIARRFEVRLEDLIALNGITNPDQIQAGQKLQIPPPTILVTGKDSTTSSAQVP